MSSEKKKYLRTEEEDFCWKMYEDEKIIEVHREGSRAKEYFKLTTPFCTILESNSEKYEDVIKVIYYTVNAWCPTKSHQEIAVICSFVLSFLIQRCGLPKPANVTRDKPEFVKSILQDIMDDDKHK